jgi:hypothetical protein
MRRNFRANTLCGLIWNEYASHVLPHLAFGIFTLQKTRCKIKKLKGTGHQKKPVAVKGIVSHKTCLSN